MKILHDHLETKSKLKIDQEIQFTDGCSAQFKSSTTVADLSFSTQDWGFPVIRNFFESCHGKGPSDGEAGVVKAYVSRKVKSSLGDVIVRNAEDFYNTVVNSDLPKKEGNFKRTFYLVQPSHIPRPRPLRTPAPNSLKIGIRQLHSIKGIRPGVVQTRKLSCFCDGCRKQEDCKFSNYVDEWKTTAVRIPCLRWVT